MELPQPRPYGAEGRKTTHDFLSLYSPVQQDPRPSQAGGYFKTHDFLQPLEQLGKNVAKEENNIEVAFIEKPPPSAPPSPPSVKHILPGGIGTYSICYNDQRVPKPEGSLFTVARESSADRNDENSNCSSYTGSGFTLWDESSTKKGKTGKENISADRHVVRETGVNLGGGQWKTPLERPSQSFSSHKLNSMALSSLPSSQPSSAQKSQGLINMLKSSKAGQEEEEDDDDDEEEIVIKKEPSSHLKGNLSLKVDGKSTDQKPNTPRSKHSATEQRRRSKINDRFQRLREIIPNSDQKRDKASFLLEVIEYIQYLQEKVHKYEGPYQGWNHEPPKLMTWGKCYKTGEGFIEQSQCANSGSAQAAIFSTKFDDNKNGLAQTISVNGQQLVDSEIRTIATPKEHSQQPESINKAASCPLQLQHDIFPFRESSSAAASISMGAAPDINKRASDLQSQYWQNGSCATDSAVASDHKQKDHEQTIESGSISVSSAYSRGLLSSLTKALQNSGVDLSQASISVEIDLGKKAANSRPYSSASAPKDDNVSMSNQAISHPISADMGQEPDRALKRLKTSRS